MSKKKIFLSLFLVLVLAVVGYDGVKKMQMNALDATLIIEDLKVGEGAEAQTGKNVTVHYTGWLAADGKKFDSSVTRKLPFVFKLGARQVIRGWDKGIVGMKVNGKRKLTIPAPLAYGERGAGDIIPPNATLIFEVDLLKVE